MDGLFSWPERLCDAVDPISAGVYAGLIAVVVLTINVLFRRWITPGQMGLMWAIVLVRLLLPFAPSSPLSLQNLFPNGESHTNEIGQDGLQHATASIGTAPTLQQNAVNSSTPSDSDETIQWTDVFFSALPIVWFVVGVVWLIYTLISYARICSQVRHAAPCDDDRLQRLWAECRKVAGVKARGSIVVLNELDQPAIMGSLRPTLLLPIGAAQLSDEQLRMIMLHELAHVRRWDLVTNWALVTIRTVHWWNPVYWLAAARFRSLREQACDAFVIRTIKEQPIHAYSELLLKLSERPAANFWRVRLPASILGFFPSSFRKRSVRCRLKALRQAGTHWGKFQSVGIAGVFLLLAAAGLTDATPQQESPKDLPSWMAQPRPGTAQLPNSFDWPIVYTGPRLTKDYDIEKVLDQIKADGNNRDDARNMLKGVLELTFQSESMSDFEASDSKGAVDKNGADRKQLVFVLAGNKLVASAPTGLHEKLKQAIDAWTESGLGQTAVTTRFISTNINLASKAGFTWQQFEAFSADTADSRSSITPDGRTAVRATSRVDDYLPVVVTTLNKDQLNAVLMAAQDDRRTNVLQAPKITFFNGQEALVADCTQRPFVVGVHPIVGPLATANEPKITVVEEGTKIALRSVQSRDHKQIHLEANLTMSQIEGVASATISLRGEEVTIQVPRVNHRVVDVASDIKDGESLLIGCLPTDSKQQYFYYLLTADILSARVEAR